MGKQGQAATNKDNNINIIKALYYCHISLNMACFCKLMAQNGTNTDPQKINFIIYNQTLTYTFKWKLSGENIVNYEVRFWVITDLLDS